MTCFTLLAGLIFLATIKPKLTLHTYRHSLRSGHLVSQKVPEHARCLQLAEDRNREYSQQRKKKTDSRNAKCKVFFRLRQQITALHLPKNWPDRYRLLGVSASHQRGNGEPGCDSFSVDRDHSPKGFITAKAGLIQTSSCGELGSGSLRAGTEEGCSEWCALCVEAPRTMRASLLKPCAQWGRYSHLRAQNCPFFYPPPFFFFQKKKKGTQRKMAKTKHTKMEDSKYLFPDLFGSHTLMSLPVWGFLVFPPGTPLLYPVWRSHQCPSYVLSTC